MTTFSLALRSFDPRDFERDLRLFFFSVEAESGVVVTAGSSTGSSTIGSLGLHGWGSVGGGSGSCSGGPVASSPSEGCSPSGWLVPSAFSSTCDFSPSLTASTCIGGRRPSFIRGKEAARLSFATAKARCSAAVVCSISAPGLVRR